MRSPLRLPTKHERCLRQKGAPGDYGLRRVAVDIGKAANTGEDADVLRSGVRVQANFRFSNPQIRPPLDAASLFLKGDRDN